MQGSFAGGKGRSFALLSRVLWWGRFLTSRHAAKAHLRRQVAFTTTA